VQVGYAVLKIMTEHGLQGTSVGRIAEEVGLNPPSLYTHFDSREEMLLEALGPMSEILDAWWRGSTDTDVLERLRSMGESHLAIDQLDVPEGLPTMLPTYQFVTAPRETGLPEAIGRLQMRGIEKGIEVIEEGKRQGTIRPDADSREAAWHMAVFAWAEDLARLMGVDEFIDRGYSKRMLDLFLRDIAASTEGECPEAEHAISRKDGPGTT
jgi:AcrR family transcriptional regulator